MSGSSTYDDLLKQVESLRAENTSLRRELHDNSSHLTQLECDATSMKDGLRHLQDSMVVNEDGADDMGNTDTTYVSSTGTADMTYAPSGAGGGRCSSRTSSHSGTSSSRDELLRLNEYNSHGGSNASSIMDQLDQNSNETDENHLDHNTQQQWPSTTSTSTTSYNHQHQRQQFNPLTAQSVQSALNTLSTEHLHSDIDGNTTTTTTTTPYVTATPTSKQSEFQHNAATNNHQQPIPPGTTTNNHLQPIPAGGAGGQKSASNSPGGSPSKKRSGDHEMYEYIQELDQQRTSILREVDNEEQQRKWFYDQLDTLAKRLDSLPLSEKQYSLQTDMSRRQLEGETSQIRHLMHDNLGTAAQIAQRHETRMQRVRAIETEMLRMQQQHKQQLELEKRDSGTCDHIEADNDGIIVVDAATNTLVSGDSYPSSPAPDRSLLPAAEQQQNASFHESSVRISGANGTTEAVVNIGSQTTAETALAEAERLARAGRQKVNGTSAEQSPPRHGAGADAPQLHDGHKLASLYHGAWPLQSGAVPSEGSLTGIANQDTASVMSFYSSAQSTQDSHPHRPVTNQQLSTKVEMVYSLLSMLGTNNKDDMSRTLLAMSSSQDSCISMRRSGCLPLLIQLLHGSEQDTGLLGNTRGSQAARARASAALHNIVHSHPDDKRGRREARVLRLLEQIRAHCDQIRLVHDGNAEKNGEDQNDIDHHPGPAIAALMKLSFDEEHRHAICTLGGLQAIAELLQVDYEVNQQTCEQYNVTMRRYACMALTNLTFGDGTNKALLCSMNSCMSALVAQLNSRNEDLRQVAASVLRNLSWRADLASKKTLRSVGAVPALTGAAMAVGKESTLKSVLSALWNLSAHCSENKADICAVHGSLGFLVSTLTYRSPSKTLAVIENGGGILRNISSHVAVREDYRRTLREHACLNVLLKHLRSPSLTIVSNACGTLWNLSARCLQDQHALWEMGAVAMLRNLVHSKHKMISMGSAAALKNLITAGPPPSASGRLDASGLLRGATAPGLHVRKQRALEAEIDQSLAETCDNVDSPQDSPTEVRRVKNNDLTVQHNANQQVVNGHKFIFSSDDLANDSRGDNCGIYQLADTDGHRRSLVRTHQFGRSYTSAEGANLLDGHVRSPSRAVSRSGSQDSVGSVHSDISHDRHRVHSVLAKSTKLLQDHQSGSALENHEKHSPKSDSDNKTTNRIVQAMNEVAIHAGINKDNQNSVDSPQRQQISVSNSANGQCRIPLPNHNNVHKEMQPRYVNVSAYRSQMTDDSEPSQDEPVDYSTKYTDNTQQYEKAIPKVSNYVGGVFNNGQTPQTYASQPDATESDEKPTDFGMLYSEQNDPNEAGDYNSERPVNYSSRYQESNQEPVTANNYTSQPPPTQYNDTHSNHMDDDNDDVVQTFCTEDTPLNFLSTATSMSDLREKAKDTEESSSCSSHSDKQQAQANIRNNNVLLVAGSNGDVAPSINSYDDEGVSSPGEDEPTTYCEEGTPACFSRVSSLSSLHSSDMGSVSSNASAGSSINSANVTAISNKNNETLVLQSIDENASLEINNSSVIDKTICEDANASQSEQDSSFQSTAATHGSQSTMDSTPTSGHHATAAKSVTFDESSQQQTPMMFSRCSSLGSLSSFDAHSVHSSVVSEYSRRASEVVSPSDLPDSPSDTMPPSPNSWRKNAQKFNLNETTGTEDSDVNETTQIENPIHAQKSPFGDRTHNFGVQNSEECESAKDDFSCATSLSALTFDDDDTQITKEDGLKRIPLGAEQETEPSVQHPAEDEKKHWEEESFELGDSDNDSIGEDMLAECIKQAMPQSKAKHKNQSSRSDGQQKQKPRESSGLPLPQMYASNHSASPIVSRLPTIRPSAAHVSFQQHPVHQSPRQLTPSSRFAYPCSGDVLKAYQTEGTPINFSNAGSLSDLSSLGCADGAESNTPPRVNQPHLSPPRSASSIDDNKSDLSSLSGDCEDLLTEAIEAAMPKSGKKSSKNSSKSTSSTATPNVTNGHMSNGNQHTQRFVKPKPAAAVSLFTDNSKMPQPIPRQDTSNDTYQTYAVEGTPLNFSRTTSLSDITDLHAGLDDLHDSTDVPRNSQPSNTMDEHLHVCDSPKVYDMEGTPVSFSRNDSLSDLSCDDDADPGTPKHVMMRAKHHAAGVRALHTPPVRSPLASPMSGTSSAGKSGKPVQSALARVKASATSRRALQYSTPKGAIIPPNLSCAAAEDIPMQFDVEGTPACFSDNSSLSSLNSSDEHNRSSDLRLDDTVIMRNTSLGHDDSRNENASYVVEDTPAVFSCNSSLSSLSIDSLNFETSASDAALLDECINLGMPKSKPASKHATSSNSRLLKKKSTSKNDPEPQHINERPQAGAQNDDSTKFHKDQHNQELKSPTHVFSQDVENVVAAIEESEMYAPDSGDEGNIIRANDFTKENVQLDVSQLGLNDSGSSHSSGPIISKEEIESTKEHPMSASSGTVSDIMCESFPNMGNSMVSTITTPDEETKSVSSDKTSFNYENSELPTPYVPDDYELADEDASVLEEQAQIILDELSINKSLVDSAVSDELFIEDERISLVSMEDASDMEASFSHSCNIAVTDSSLPVQDVCISEEASDSEISDTETTINSSPAHLSAVEDTPTSSPGHAQQRRPRILKPGEKSNVVKPEPEVKVIKGKRKPLYAPRTAPPPAQTKTVTPPSKVIRPVTKQPAKSVTPSKSTVRTPVNNKNTAKNTVKSNIQSAATKRTTPVQAKKTPPKAAVKTPSKTPPKTPPRVTSLTPKSSPVKPTIRPAGTDKSGAKSRSPKSVITNRSLTPTRSDSSRNSSPGRTGTQSTPPKVNAVKPNNSKLPSKIGTKKTVTPERPAGPIKQGTFTKDSPTHNPPDITPDVDKSSPSGSSRNSVSSAELKCPQESQGKLNMKPESATSDASPVKSSIPRGRATTVKPKTDPSKQSPRQAGSVIPQTAVTRRRSSASPSSSNGLNTSNSNSNSHSNRSSIGSSQGSLNSKTSSRSSLNRNSAVSPVSRLPRNNSGSKIASPSGVATPKATTTLRKTSVDSTSSGNSGTFKAPNKKPAKSKIASLWRKDDKKVKEEKKPAKESNKKSETSAKTTKGLRSVFRASGRQNSKTKEEPSDEPAGITKSSTYDKIVVKKDDEVNDIPQDAANIDDADKLSVQSDGKRMWRRTYTIEDDGLVIQTSGAWQSGDDTAPDDVEPDKVKPKKSGISIWRRGGSKSNKQNSESSTHQPKKGLWRRNKSSKPTTPQDPGEVVSAEGSGVWMMRDGSQERSEEQPEAANETETSTPAASVPTKPPPLSPTQPTGTTNAAIVAPFNYRPKKTSNDMPPPCNVPNKAQTLPANMSLPSDQDVLAAEKAAEGMASTTSLTSLDGTPMTKTEMLMARRRRSYMTNMKSEEPTESEEAKNAASCLITTV